MSASFSLEGPFLKTVKLLLTRPGVVYHGFLAGQRKSFYQPVGFCILASAIYLILRQLLDYDPLEGRVWQDPNQEVPKLTKKTREAAYFMVSHINHIMFFLIFSVGLMLKAFFPKRYNLAEYTTIGFYVTGTYILVCTPLMIFGHFSGIKPHNIQLLCLFAITLAAGISMSLKNNVWRYVKSLLVSVFSVVLYMFFGFLFSFFMVWFR